ncbi:MAG: tetratricopeptide repeat protein [Treponemataceae bacterium]
MIKKTLLFIFCSCTLLQIFAQSQEKSVFELYAKAKQNQENRSWYQAIELYQEIVQLNPHYGQAWFGLAECSYAMNEYELAIFYAESAEKYIKNQAAIQNIKGFSFIGLNRLDEAKQIFTKVLNVYPNDSDAYFGLAELNIFEGKISSAETNYLDILKRQPENRKALLSLALVSYELGKLRQAKTYINQAIRYHSENPDVHYFAAYLYAKDGDFYLAEQRAQAAVHLNPSYDKAYELLGFILYQNARFYDVIALCDERLQRNRNLTSAWFLKGLANTKLNKIEEAINAYTLGLSIDSEDEIMRTSLEQLIFFFLDIEDKRRSQWSAWHIQKAQTYQQKYLLPQAKYEYRRALMIEPNNSKTRYDYADILLKEGYPERYFSQLQFLKAQGGTSTLIEDRLSSIGIQLTSSLPNKWKIDPFYLERIRYKVGLYYQHGNVNLYHADADKITSDLLAHIISQDGLIEASSYGGAINSFSEAFNLSRQGSQDYFIILNLEENKDDLYLTCKIFVSRTGIEVSSFTIYRTGNDRFINTLRRANQAIASSLEQKGKLIERNGSIGLIDMGKSDGIKKDQVFNIIKKGMVKTADKSIALNYKKTDILGTFTVTKVGEDICEGTIKVNGFNDHINRLDEIVFLPEDIEGQKPQSINASQKPALINLIQNIN